MVKLIMSYFIGLVSLQIGIAILTGVYMMFTFAIWMVNADDILSSSSNNLDRYVIIGMMILMFATWFIAFSGAYNESRELISYAIICWAVFVSIWITFTVYSIVKGKNYFCVAKPERCLPNMWLFQAPKAINPDSNEDLVEGDEHDYSTSTKKYTTKAKTKKPEKVIRNKLYNSGYDNVFKFKKITTGTPVTTDSENIISTKFTNTKKKRMLRRMRSVGKAKLARIAKTTTDDESLRYDDVAFENDGIDAVNPVTADPITTSSARTTKKIVKDVRKSTTKRVVMTTEQNAYNYDVRKMADEYETEAITDNNNNNNNVTPSENTDSTYYLKYAISILYFLPLFAYSWCVIISYYMTLKHCKTRCVCRKSRA